MKHTLTITWHSHTVLDPLQGDYQKTLIMASLDLIEDLVDMAVTSVQVEQESD